MKNNASKILTLAVAVLPFLSVAEASTDHFNQGFYIGGALGPGWGHAVWDGVTNINAINDQGAPVSVSERWVPQGDSQDINVVGRAMLGYQFIFKPLYLGFEIGGTFSDDFRFERHESKQYFNSYLDILSTVDAKALSTDTVTLGGNEFNMDIKPGWVLASNFLAYARVGLAINQLTMNSHNLWSTTNTFLLEFPDPYTVNAEGSADASKTAYGIRLGLGAEFLADNHVGVTIDYIYAYYGNISTVTSGSDNTVFLGPTEPQFYAVSGTNAPEVTISTQSLTLGLIYHF